MLHVIPATITSLKELEKVNYVNYTLTTEHETGEGTPCCSTVRLSGQKRDCVKKLKALCREAAELHAYVRTPDKWQGWALNVSDRKTWIKESLKSLAELNRNLNRNDEGEFKENQLQYINEVELMMSMSLLKAYDLQDIPGIFDSSYALGADISDTFELMHRLSVQMRQLTQYLPELKHWFVRSTQSSVVRRNGLTAVQSLEDLITEQMQERKMYIDLRAGMADRAFFQAASSAKRMEDLQGYDRLMMFAWQQAATKLKLKCIHLMSFAQRFVRHNISQSPK